MIDIIRKIIDFIKALFNFKIEDFPYEEKLEEKSEEIYPQNGISQVEVSETKKEEKIMLLREGIQTNFKDPVMARWGCYWFTLARWSQIVSNRAWTDDELVAKFAEHRRNKWINDDDNAPWARNPVAIFNDMAGDCGYFANVEHTRDATDFPGTLRFPVFYQRTTPNGFDHFALGERDPNAPQGIRIVFDSWLNSAAARGMPIHNFRRFR